MDFLPWSTFTRIVTRYGGDQRVSWAEHYRAIGVRPTDLPGKSARYRDLPVGASVETLCHGLSRSGAPLDAGRCQRGARLADLRGVGPAADRPGAQAVSRRGFGVRPRQYGLRARFDDHRSLPGGVSVGAFP